MKRGYADGPFGQIHFCDSGQGTPLVLFHQAPMSHRQFDSVYALLHQRGIRAIGVDMPGFGLSDPTDFVPSIRDYAEIYPSLLNHLDINAAFVLGHHTGAEVVTEVSLNFPNRVVAVVLNGPAPFDDDMREQGLRYVENREKGFRPKADGSHLAEAFETRMSYANKDTNWNLATRYIAEQFIGLGPFWYGHHAAYQYDHAAGIADISHPTLILTNTGDVIYDLALKSHKLRPDFEFAELPGGGVDIVDEMPELWVAHVCRFIASVS